MTTTDQTFDFDPLGDYDPAAAFTDVPLDDAGTTYTSSDDRLAGTKKAIAAGLASLEADPFPPLPDLTAEQAAVDPHPVSLDAFGLAEARPARFEVMSRDALRHLPPPSWLLDGLLIDQGLICLFGPSGLGKSFVAIDLACGIATGTSSFGHRALRPGPVLYIAGEGVSGLNQRIGAWEKTRNTPVDRLFTIPEAPNLLETADVDGVLRASETLDEAPSLLIIDTLARAMIGDENNAHDMGLLVRAGDRLKRHLGCSVMFVHHTLKPQPGKPVTERGSGALRGAMDQMLRLQKDDENSPEITLISDKLKDGKPFDSKAMVLTPAELSMVLLPAHLAQQGTSLPKPQPQLPRNDVFDSFSNVSPANPTGAPTAAPQGRRSGFGGGGGAVVQGAPF